MQVPAGIGPTVRLPSVTWWANSSSFRPIRGRGAASTLRVWCDRAFSRCGTSRPSRIPRVGCGATGSSSAALETAAVIEGVLRPDVLWRPLAIILAVVMIPSLLWRRTHPLAVIVVVFGSLTVIDVLAPATREEPFGLYTMAFVLLLPYALARWGSGRDIVIGLAVTLGLHVVRTLVHLNVGDLLVGIPILLVPALLGLAVRYQSNSRTRELDQVKMREREQLARELHDTVAHHVSAIVIQAQAGRVTAGSRPDAAIEALRVIESEASLTLAEMRDIVGTLRDGSAAELVPQRGLADLPLLASVADGTPPVERAGVRRRGRPAPRRSARLSTGSRRSRSPTPSVTRGMPRGSTCGSWGTRTPSASPSSTTATRRLPPGPPGATGSWA